VCARNNRKLFDEQMRTSECINQPALNEARLVIVDESFDLNRDGGHGFKQPNVELSGAL